MQTVIAKKLGIQVPIFAFTHCRDVVVAVSKAAAWAYWALSASRLSSSSRSWIGSTSTSAIMFTVWTS